MGGAGGALVVVAALGAALAVVASGAGRLRAARAALAGAALLAGLAVLLLGLAMWRVDTTLVEVATTTSRSTAAPLRLAALWAGPLGSLLCFATITCVVAAVAARRVPAPAVTAMATPVAVLLSMAAWAQPFRATALAPLDGSGLVPVLRRTTMLVHPPVVYLGLALVLVPAAIAVADLAGQAGDGHRRLGRQVALIAWALLAVGMVLGSRWAHREVGWGGVWAWDPVEDAALLPWLALTASFHTRSPRAWWAGAGLLAWAGTWVTRSGRLSSVHAFSGRGAVSLGLGLALVVFAVVVAALAVAPVSSRKSWRWPGPVGLLAAAAVVWVGAGTGWAAIGGSRYSVAAAFYVSLVGPLAVAALALFARGLPRAELTAAGLLGAGGAGALAISGPRSIGVLAVAAVAPAAVAGSLMRRTRWGVTLAHLGLVLLVAGSVATTNGQAGTARLAVDDERQVAGIDVRLVGLREVRGADRRGVAAVLEVGGRRLSPALVDVELLGPRADVATATSWRGEVQAALVSTDGAGTAVVSVATTPGALWVWAGGLLLALGGLVEAVARRRRRPEPTAPLSPAMAEPSAL